MMQSDLQTDPGISGWNFHLKNFLYGISKVFDCIPQFDYVQLIKEKSTFGTK